MTATLDYCQAFVSAQQRGHHSDRPTVNGGDARGCARRGTHFMDGGWLCWQHAEQYERERQETLQRRRDAMDRSAAARSPW